MRQRKALNERRSQYLWPLLVALGQVISGWRAGRNYARLPEVLPMGRRTSPQQDRHKAPSSATPHPPVPTHEAEASPLPKSPNVERHPPVPTHEAEASPLPKNPTAERPRGDDWPSVSIIVPVRNEAENIGRLLDSLIIQDYPSYEVIVVNDASTDETANIVLRYAESGVRLLESEEPPSGWTGKNTACWLGARASQHSWLLFVDADTTLAPLALRSSIAFALEQGTAALSLFTRQRCASFWERLLLPFAYQQYFVGVNAQRIHSSKGPALANGQYFLMQRTAYFHAGGHATTARSIIDDVSLATSLKKSGVPPLACRGEQLVAVRMYTGLRAIIAGFSKNSYLFLRHSPSTGIQTAVSTALAASILPLAVEAWRKRSWRSAAFALVAYLVQVMGCQGWYRRFGVRWQYALLAPVAALSFLGIALNSMLRGKAVPWKGRHYHRARTRYRLPFQWYRDMGRAMLTKTPRSIADDSAFALGLLPQPPHVTGTEHIPQEGSFVLVSNHYQRLDLWIGWSGAVLINAVAKQRTEEITFHYITTDRARIGRFTVPGTRWIIQRVAAVWSLILVTPPTIAHEHVEGQRFALLRLLRLVRNSTTPVCIGLMPEGDEGNTLGLKEALPGSGRSLLTLSRQGLPLVPAAVWEVDGQLHAQFGAPFSVAAESQQHDPTASDAIIRQRVMQHIAALLPCALRGTIEEVAHGTLG